MTSIKQQLEADIEDIAVSIKVFKQAVQEIVEAHGKLNEPLDRAETALRVILPKSFVCHDEKQREAVHQLMDDVQRLR